MWYCHLKLGHTARNCSLDACSDVFDCGFEKFHTRQINRTKLNQELKREETALQKLENELRTRRFAVRSLKETLTSQIENKLLRENGPDYHVGNFCKRNFNGKIPPKQNLSYILGLAEADERQQQSLSQPKRRRVHENPAKSVLEMQHGVCFPDTSVQTTSLSALSCNSNLFRCEPRTEEEEEAQLDLALKASSLKSLQNGNTYTASLSLFITFDIKTNMKVTLSKNQPSLYIYFNNHHPSLKCKSSYTSLAIA